METIFSVLENIMLVRPVVNRILLELDWISPK